MDIDISKFVQCKVLVVGDLMVDEYLWGETDRISPEAPVQVVSVKNEDYTLGGAGNVVNNLVSLGATVSVAGAIGADRHGKRLQEMFNELGVDTEGIVQEQGRSTTRKKRIIAANQHVLRLDWETTYEISDQTLEKIIQFVGEKISETKVVLISDYGKGLITRPLLSKLAAVTQKHKKITIADPKGLDFSKYSGLSLLTPNRKEAALAAGIEIVDESTLSLAAARILDAAKLEKVLITCGKNGMVLFSRGKKPYIIKTKIRQVYDVSGAGDTVVAVLGLAVASGFSFEEGAVLANTAAGIVVGKVGTATVSKKEITDAIKPHPDKFSSKQKTFPELLPLSRELKRKGKKIVLTNGCFDLLHAGHINLFAESKKNGDVLVVAIDDDDSVRAIKGMGRPVIKAKDRVRILSALDSIDYVVVFSSEELKKLIEFIRPDILTKGGNYTAEEVAGRKTVEQFGGRVVLIPAVENISSTGIIHNIKNFDLAVSH